MIEKEIVVNVKRSSKENENVSFEMKDYSEEEKSFLIKKTILNLVDKFLKRGDFFVLPEEGKIKPDASHINNGFCFSFAEELVDELRKNGIDAVYVEKEHDEVPHAFIKVDDKFYDSQCPEGVSAWKLLPLYRELPVLSEKAELDFTERFKPVEDELLNDKSETIKETVSIETEKIKKENGFLSKIKSIFK